MDKKSLFESLVYVDRDFIATAYEAFCDVAPDTQVTKAETKGAGMAIPIFSANVSAVETRSFKMSTFGMLAKILDDLDEYDVLPNPPLGETGRSALGWVEGELTVSTVKLRKDQKSHSDHKPDRPAAYGPGVDASETVFSIRGKGGLRLTLITTDSYFSSGVGALLGLSEVVVDVASIPVRALVRVLDVQGSFDDWLAVPCVMLDADHDPKDRTAALR